ncbi:HD domain-containing protein [Actinokineospora globicatena]|uniref:Phosphohydrolase n=1 Tax=Actinokineospora globicatena TaxID=103729 RepID=A0A9W6QI49_9PSEU|nr:HD domain-containing protein [Actinokineospora globicatena]GLW90476.1 phosphohydrolase [Actinokineospora globicatena]
MTGDIERIATDTSEPALRPLPRQVIDLLIGAHASPRLVAHLRAVHDVAWLLIDWVAASYPTVGFDRDAVAFGAATHDIGKAEHPEELSGPGSAHEPAGYALLLRAGVAEDLARFARDHASWHAESTLDDLLVTLADKVWKGKRVDDLERLVIERLAGASGQQPWEAFMALDDELRRIADDADRRLAYQAAHPIA